MLTPKLNTTSKGLNQNIKGEMRAENINEPSEQEIDRQSDSDSNSCQSADNGSDGEEGQGVIHSTPMAQRKSARERKLPKKYDGFILGPMKQLNAILENHLLGRVFTSSNNYLKFVFKDGPVIILKHHGRCFFPKEGSM